MLGFRALLSQLLASAVPIAAIRGDAWRLQASSGVTVATSVGIIVPITAGMTFLVPYLHDAYSVSVTGS